MLVLNGARNPDKEVTLPNGKTTFREVWKQLQLMTQKVLKIQVLDIFQHQTLDQGKNKNKTGLDISDSLPVQDAVKPINSVWCHRGIKSCKQRTKRSRYI